MYKFLHFEDALAFKDNISAFVSMLRGQTINGRLINEMYINTYCDLFCGFAQFLYNFLIFENITTSENVLRGCYDVLEGQGSLKKQKNGTIDRSLIYKSRYSGIALLHTQGDSTS